MAKEKPVDGGWQGPSEEFEEWGLGFKMGFNWGIRNTSKLSRESNTR